MDPRQRVDDLSVAVGMAVRKKQAQMWTALPAIIQSVDFVKMTVEARPSVQGTAVDPKTGVITNVNMPLLVDCPIVFPSAGGVSLTLPIAPGDECLIVFASRCIDAWWQNGGTQPPMLNRMHDLSDGFCLPGVKSKPRALTTYSATTAQLRSDDGSTYVEIDPAGGIVNIVAPGGCKITTPELYVTGDITTGSGSTFNGIAFDSHTHSGVTAGSDETGAPV
jgi:hypothetical protein